MELPLPIVPAELALKKTQIIAPITTIIRIIKIQIHIELSAFLFFI
jgi:hypothetical protein